MHTVICKSISGDFYIGKLEQRDGITYLVDVYNLVLHPSPDNPQQVRSLMLPIMMPFDDKAVKEISIDKFILAVIEAPGEVERTYIKLTTGLDIVVPGGSKIIQ
jgi:hypothetical protein